MAASQLVRKQIMRMHTLLFLVTIGYAWQAHAQADPDQLVGFSSNSFRGDAGVRAMTNGCLESFGPAARMCKSTEALETVAWPQVDVSAAWLQPVFVSGSGGTGVDASGVFNSSPARLSCDGWSQQTGTGLTVNSEGKFRSSGCNSSRRVACCTPVPLP
jgi:hypothetical protein